MSFNQGSSSGTLSFAPARYTIKWDGTSEAKATFALSCPDTAATYAAVAWGIYDISETLSCYFNTSTSGTGSFSAVRGARQYVVNNSCVWSPVNDAPIPSSAASGTVTIIFSSLTTTFAVHAWKLTATKGTTSRVVIAGRLEKTDFDPYGAGGGTISLVSGTTAHKCI